MTLSSKPLAVTLLVLVFGGILFSSAMGWWQTESTKQAATFSEGEFAGLPNPADIRGSYTFGDVETNFGVPATTLAQAFGVLSESNPSTFGVKDLETLYADQEFEVGTASVRLFVALYTGLPYEIVGDLYLPQRAIEMLKAHATLTIDQIAYLEAHAVTPEPTDNVQATPQPVPVMSMEASAEMASTEDRTLKGKTSFQEVLDWGVPQEIVEGIIGGPMPNPLTRVKDFCSEQGLSFEEIRPAFQAEINKIK
jgi:hypothetical protein